jgi:AraC-like DNA-binding protein
MIGALFGPAGASSFVRVPMSDLADQAVSIGDLWGNEAITLAAELRELDELGRLERFEFALQSRLAIAANRWRPVNVEGLAATVIRHRGRVTVEGLARAAGVSRQHLTREFRNRIGVPPKLYARIVRFQSGLSYAGCQHVDWAVAAVEMGYADQSHLIAEFRRFSGLTPQELAARDWFHPFIERTRSERHRPPRP